MIIKLLSDINFWSAICGLSGSIFIFFFGIPPRVDPCGHIHLILEQENKEDIVKGKKFKIMSYIGLLLIGLSFLLQIINLIQK